MTPSGRGFSRFYGSYDDASDYVQHCDLNGHYDLHYEEAEHFESNASSRERPYHFFPSGDGVVGKHTNTLFQAKALQFIRDHKEKHYDKPMFLYFAPMSFQEPLQAPKWTAANCTGATGFLSAANRNRQTLCRMATALDKTIHDLAATMEDTFAGDNWVMVIASDSGGAAAHMKSGGSNWPLTGSRGEVWEGGMRTRALVTGKHPELAAAATKGGAYSNGFMHMVDWHATILELAHSSPQSREPPNDMDGMCMWDALMQDGPSPRKEFISNVSGRGVAIRYEDYKLVMAPSAGKNPLTGEKQGFRWPVRSIDNQQYLSLYDGDSGSKWMEQARWKLFDVRNDPAEQEDLAQVLPEEVLKLAGRFKAALQGRKSSGNDILSCPNGCDGILAKAAEVMQTHSETIALNKCPAKEGAFPFWEEAALSSSRPFSTS